MCQQGATCGPELYSLARKETETTAETRMGSLEKGYMGIGATFSWYFFVGLAIIQMQSVFKRNGSNKGSPYKKLRVSHDGTYNDDSYIMMATIPDIFI